MAGKTDRLVEILADMLRSILAWEEKQKRQSIDDAKIASYTASAISKQEE